MVYTYLIMCLNIQRRNMTLKNPMSPAKLPNPEQIIVTLKKIKPLLYMLKVSQKNS